MSVCASSFRDGRRIGWRLAVLVGLRVDRQTTERTGGQTISLTQQAVARRFDPSLYPDPSLCRAVAVSLSLGP